MAYKPKAPEVMPEPNVVPMADIMLVLLIIFMVVTPMLQKGVSVDMARTREAEDMKAADQDDSILIAVARDGKIYLGTTQVELEQVADVVSDLWETTTVKTVYVKSDRRARFGRVASLVDEIRSIGVDKLGLLTEKIEQAGSVPMRPVPAESPASP